MVVKHHSDWYTRVSKICSPMMMVHENDANDENVVTRLCMVHTFLGCSQSSWICSLVNGMWWRWIYEYLMAPKRLPEAFSRSAIVRYSNRRRVWFLASGTVQYVTKIIIAPRMDREQLTYVQISTDSGSWRSLKVDIDTFSKGGISVVSVCILTTAHSIYGLFPFCPTGCYEHDC